MSGAMRKIGEYLGLLEDTGRYDDYDGDDETAGRAGRGARARPPSRASRRPAPRVRPRRAPSSGARSRPEWSPSCPGSPPCTRAPTTRRAPSARTSATACR